MLLKASYEQKIKINIMRLIIHITRRNVFREKGISKQILFGTV